MGKVRPGTVILGVVAMAAIAAGLLLGLALTGHLDSDTTPIVTVVLGFIASTATSLVAVLKVDSISHDLRNGLISDKVTEANNDAQSAPVPVSITRKGGNDGGSTV